MSDPNLERLQQLQTLFLNDFVELTDTGSCSLYLKKELIANIEGYQETEIEGNYTTKLFIKGGYNHEVCGTMTDIITATCS